MWDIFKKDSELPSYPLSRWALGHPILTAIVSSIVIASWTNFTVGDWRAISGIAATMFLLQLLLWLPEWGPARRRTERMCDVNAREVRHGTRSENYR